jgi:actin-like ATPase involved in cell morphogenesis
VIFYSHIINWAHGRRDYPVVSTNTISESIKKGYTTEWNDNEKKKCTAFFKSIRSNDDKKIMVSQKELVRVLKDALKKISHSERRD